MDYVGSPGSGLGFDVGVHLPRHDTSKRDSELCNGAGIGRIVVGDGYRLSSMLNDQGS